MLCCLLPGRAGRLGAGAAGRAGPRGHHGGQRAGHLWWRPALCRCGGLAPTSSGTATAAPGGNAQQLTVTPDCLVLLHPRLRGGRGCADCGQCAPCMALCSRRGRGCWCLGALIWLRWREAHRAGASCRRRGRVCSACTPCPSHTPWVATVPLAGGGRCSLLQSWSYTQGPRPLQARLFGSGGA